MPLPADSYVKMDPAEKATWVAALRSGDYKQTTRQLYHDGAYCCLGVNLKVVHSVPESPLGGFNTRDWMKSIHLDTEVINRLVDMNDKEGKTFKEIADWIEEHL